MRMDRRAAWAILLVFGALLGCSSGPPGYTRAAWRHYRHDHPDSADILEWLVRDPERTRVREALAKACPLNETIQDPERVLRENDDAEIIPLAQKCMDKSMDFKQAAIAGLREQMDANRGTITELQKAVADQEQEITRLRFIMLNDPAYRNDPRKRAWAEAEIRRYLDLIISYRRKIPELARRIGREAQAVSTLQ